MREAFARWEGGGPVFGALLADDVVWTIPGSGPVARTYHGKTDFIEQASAPLLSRVATPLVPEVHAIWADGDTVIVHFDGAATTSGAPYNNQFVWIFGMEDGKVVRGEGRQGINRDLADSDRDHGPALTFVAGLGGEGWELSSRNASSVLIPPDPRDELRNRVHDRGSDRKAGIGICRQVC